MYIFTSIIRNKRWILLVLLVGGLLSSGRTQEQLIPIDNLSGPLKFERKILGNFYKVVYFKSFLSSTEYSDLEKRGVRLLDYFGEKTYLASIPSKLTISDLKELGVSHLRDLKVEERDSWDVNSGSVPHWASEGDKVLLSIQYFANLPSKYVIEQCSHHNIEVRAENGVSPFMQIAVRKSDLSRVIDLPFVRHVEPIEEPAIPDDYRGQALHRVNRVHGSPRNYNGDGINVMVRDDGAVFDHIDFKGRMDQSSVGDSRGDHGDGVAGIMVGAGNLDPDNQGMAYASDFWVIDYANHFLDETIELHEDHDIYITNSSYSNGCNAGYTNSTNTVDGQMNDYDKLLHVFSAGNMGEDDCDYGAGEKWGNVTGGHKIGKNVIAVANLSFTGGVMNSSSRGPAYDGRIKPDLAANGYNHVSTVESQDYEPFGGTSAAAPVVAGVASILYDAHNRHFGEIPDAALIKTIMMNTANDLGNKGPDFKYGWGSVNAYKAAKVIEEERFLTSTIEQGSQNTHEITIPSGVKQIKVMTYWQDREGTTNANKHLINDIDTHVNYKGEQYLPYVLDHSPDPERLDLPATRGEDHRNNMEQVEMDSVDGGTLELVIEGTNIPFGNSTYFVTWEFIYNDIEITYPNGGENWIQGEDQIIHWDAYGDEGDFYIEILDRNNIVIDSFTTSGDRRIRAWRAPNQYVNGMKVRISRNGISDESDDFLIMANRPFALNTVRDSLGKITFNWAEVLHAESYTVYSLGEKYMEAIDTVYSNSYELPNDEKFKIGWISVSANFANDMRGKRARAIAIRPRPESIAHNDDDLEPCVDIVTEFSTPYQDTLVQYEWNFGKDATPETANTFGPHQVTYNKRGTKIGFLRVTHEGGTDVSSFIVKVLDGPKGETISHNAMSDGMANFSSDVKNVDTYLWDFGDGNTSMEEDPIHIYEESGTFLVTLTASGKCGEIKLEKEIDVEIVATKEYGLQKFSITPNPNSGQFKVVSSEQEGLINIKILGIDGQEHFSKSRFVSGNFISLDNLIPGLYQVIIETNSNIEMHRLVVH